MRILIITPDFSPFVDLTLWLSRKSHSVAAIVPDHPQAVKPQIPIQSLPIPSLKVPFGIKKFILTPFPTQILQLIMQFKPDLIHFYHPQIYWYYPVGIWAKLKKIPVLCTFTNPKVSPYWQKLYNQPHLLNITSPQIAPAGFPQILNQYELFLHSKN